jgi:hypothetical protein
VASATATPTKLLIVELLGFDGRHNKGERICLPPDTAKLYEKNSWGIIRGEAPPMDEVVPVPTHASKNEIASLREEVARLTALVGKKPQG